MFIVRTPPSFPYLKGGDLILLPPPDGGGGGWLKIKKKRWKYGAGAGLLKRGDWHFSYLIFSKFVIFTFRNYFILCKIVLYNFAKLCYAFEEKFFFFHHNFRKKSYVTCLKMDLKISNKLR